MGETFRVFVVGDDNSLRSFPLRKYERMVKADPKESMPEYAGKRLHYALVFLELFERKPLKVIQIQYSYLCFDAEGKLDQSEFQNQARLAMEVVDTSNQNGKLDGLYFLDTDLLKSESGISTSGPPTRRLKPLS
jgi:hypothetical protein